MNLNSFDVGDKSETEKHIPISPDVANKHFKKKDACTVLSFLHSFPKGALTINETFLLFTYDPFNQAVFPKRVECTKPNHLEHYLVFDTIGQQVFAPCFLVSHETKQNLTEQIQEHVKHEIEWIELPSSEWDAIHTAVREHIDAFQNQLQKSSEKNLEPIEEQSLFSEKNQENVDKRKKKEEKKKKELEELQRTLQTLTLAELAQIFSKISNRTREIEQEFIQKIEEAKERRFEERKEAIEAKEELKEEIKLEVAKLRLVTEAQKKLSD